MPANPTPLLPAPWPPVTTPVDLEATAKTFADQRGPDRAPTSGQYRRCVQMLEHRSANLDSVAPAQAIGWVDGIQARSLLARIEHRDLTLSYLAAGSVAGTTLLQRDEMLAVVCSELDLQAVQTRGPGVPVLALPETTPWALALATDEWIDETRRSLEATVINRSPAEPGLALGVDGPLPAECERDDLVGVVKAALETEWLSDSALLPTRQGWRSPTLRIPASRITERAKLTAFVRLHTATSQHSWGHALIRVEVYEDTSVSLDAAAAMVLCARGTPSYGDPRWPIQPRPLWQCEQVLKAGIPYVLNALR